MGFKSVLKKIGKGALKVAPIAAAFIPGVGPLASMAIGGISSAASKKIGGGSWKDALLAGGIGAGSSYGLDKAVGIGPSSGFFKSSIKDTVGKTAAKTAGGGFKSVLGKAASGVAQSQGIPVGNQTQQGDDGGGWQGQVAKYAGLVGPTIAGIGAAKSLFGNKSDGNTDNRGSNVSGGDRGSIGPSEGVMPRGGFSYRNQPLNQYNQNEPNLALALHQGRQEAIAGQPWRSGYDSRWISKNTEGEPVENFATMPAIYPNVQNQRRSERRDERRAGRNG